MKPEPKFYDAVLPLPTGGIRQQVPQGVYCNGCGATFSLARKESFDGVDENGKAYIHRCLYCYDSKERD